jgi:hemolysin III
MEQLSDHPRLRGRLHALAFAVSVPAGAALVVAADRALGRTAAAVYAVSLLLVFGTSAAYHRLAHGTRARALWQRIDHSMIYLLIAGTYTPVCLVALPRTWGIPVLAVVVTGGIVGAAAKLTAFDGVGRYATVLYPVLGWVAVVAAPAMAEALTPTQITLLVLGGLAYTAGFPVLLLRRPDPWPRTFGYHEIWHTCTVVAAVLHFAAVASLVS